MNDDGHNQIERLEKLKAEPKPVQRRAAEQMINGGGVMTGNLVQVVAEIQRAKAEQKKTAARKAKRKNAKKARRAARR